MQFSLKSMHMYGEFHSVKMCNKYTSLYITCYIYLVEIYIFIETRCVINTQGVHYAKTHCFRIKIFSGSRTH